MGTRWTIAEAVRGRIQTVDKDEWVSAGKGNISSSEIRARGSWRWVISRWRETGFLWSLPLVLWVSQAVRQFLSKEEPGAGGRGIREARGSEQSTGGTGGTWSENNSKYAGIDSRSPEIQPHDCATDPSAQHQYPDLVSFDRPQDFQEEGWGDTKGARRSGLYQKPGEGAGREEGGRQVLMDICAELYWGKCWHGAVLRDKVCSEVKWGRDERVWPWGS